MTLGTARPALASGTLLSAIIVAIGSLSIYKYSASFSAAVQIGGTIAFAVAMSVALVVLAWLLHRFPIPDRVALGVLLVVLAGFALVALALLARVDRYGVEVDRWSAIQFWLDRLFAGRYPYDATTHLGQYASPFPLWQAVHIPAYLLGDVGFSQIAVFVGVCLVAVWATRNPTAILAFVLVMLGSPAFWYEVVVRSDLMSNMLVGVAAILFLGMPRRDPASAPVLVGVVGGLLLATRLLLAIPLAVAEAAGVWHLRHHPRRLAALVASATIAFAVTFVPFVLWDVGEGAFFRHNPFVLQTNKLDLWIVAVYGIVAVAASFRVSDTRSRLAGAALTLAAMMATYLVVHVIGEGLSAAIFGDLVDLAYVAVPLAFAAMAWGLDHAPQRGRDEALPA